MKSKTTAKQHWEIKLQIANKYYKTNTQIATKLSYKMKSKTTTKQHKKNNYKSQNNYKSRMKIEETKSDPT